MLTYALTCCSTADLTPSRLDEIGVRYVFFNYELDGIPCKDDFGKTHAPKELYARMLKGATVKTSQVSIGEYMEFWAPLLEAGQDVLHEIGRAHV